MVTKTLTDGFVVEDADVDSTLGALQQLQAYPDQFSDYVRWCRGESNDLAIRTVRLVSGKLLLRLRGASHAQEHIRHIVACAVGPNNQLLDPVTGQPLTRVRTGVNYLNSL